MVTRYDYRIIKEISVGDIHDYQYKLAEVASVCDLMKFAVFRGYGYWENELHDIIRVEFSRSNKFTNKELKDLLLALGQRFNFGRSAVFVMYEEVER